MDRILRRRDALRAELASQDVAALLVVDPSNVAYLTGFTGDSSYLLVGRDGRDMVLSDGRFTTQLEQECPGLEAYIRPNVQPMTKAVAEIAEKLRLPSLGFEASHLSVADFEAVKGELKSTSLAPTTGLVEKLRQIKDNEEVGLIREAVAIAQDAFLRLKRELKAGETEKEAADRLEAHMRALGATGTSFPSIVAVGVRAALPHARPTSETRIGDDDFVLIDWGACGRSYKSDLTRVVVTGNVTPKFEEVYGVVLEAQKRAVQAIRPGVKAQDVDAEARSYIEQAGFGRFFDHGLGHGIGMDVHEGPRLRRESPTILEPGMVVTVEPGIYLPEWGGVRIEDDVLVTPDGREVLSSLPKELDSVRA
ncbi:M24 family metallopeptidase [Paludisphaera rhizosphaerae]|uniref:M24 family metallopeptidase n=1 Tax=Paludisphaera rhizosphaerae TaxID=2711216 RepID=UPI0013EC13DD|nr:Xaa-Pro peptidase family protein [Paludisphaera rhizosphaerae]